MDDSLRAEASGVASKLRRSGRSVELILESKKMKWALKVGPWGLPVWGFTVCSCHFLYKRSGRFAGVKSFASLRCPTDCNI
jgi:hypothetical protein